MSQPSRISKPSRRDERLDSLRGLMLVAMATNHIASLLSRYTDHTFGYMSAAEGFVFLSGLVAGLVYTRRREKLGPAAVAAASRERSVTIYLNHLALYAALFVWAHLFYAFTGHFAGNTPPMMIEQPVLSIVTGIFLLQLPPLMDILPLYAGLMLLLPITLTALSRGKRPLVFAISVIAWGLTNLIMPQQSHTGGIFDFGAFNWGAWQLLFVLGIASGHASATGNSFLPRRKILWTILAVVIVADGYLLRHAYLPPHFDSLSAWVNKNNIAPVRLIDTLAIFYLVHLAMTRWPRAFNWPVLALLGRHSLAVFTGHIAVAYLFYSFPHYFASTPMQTWLGTGVMFAAMFSIALWQERSKRRHTEVVTAG